MKKIAPGVLLCFLIALVAWFFGNVFPLIGGPVLGILFGIIITMLIPKLTTTSISHGITFTIKKLLQYAIILLGFGMNLFVIFNVGGQSILIIIFTLLAAFLTAYVVGRILKLHDKMTILIGVGTAICGGSAIAATAPVIKAKDEDIAHAISTIFLFNVIAVFLFPSFGHALGLSDMGFGMWAGTAINDTSSVVAASTAWSNAAGNHTALTFATIVKLTRTLAIIPITMILALYMVRINRNDKTAGTFKLSKVFPWFILAFLAAACITTLLNLPATLTHTLVNLGKFLIIMAMVGIGLNTNLKKLLNSGYKPILLGLSCWLAVLGMSLVVQFQLHIW